MIRKLLLVGVTFLSISPTIQASTVYLSQGSFVLAVENIEIANFEIDGNGNPVTSNTIIDQQYVPTGMDFNPSAGGLPTAKAFIPQSLPNTMVANSEGSVGGGGGGFQVILSSPAFGIGMYFGGLQSEAQYGPTVLDLFDSTDTLIDTFTVQDEVGTSEFDLLFFGVTSDQLIKSFNVTIGELDYVWFDDVQYGDNPDSIPAVPIPAAIWLFGTALIGFVGISRKRKVS